MAIRHIVTRGFGNGTFTGTIGLVVTRGYGVGEAGITVPNASSLEFAVSPRRAHFAADNRKAHAEAVDQ